MAITARTLAEHSADDDVTGTLAIVAIRRVAEEVEARLEPVPGSAGRGTAEWKRYGDGSTRFDLSVRGLDLGDGSTIEVRVGGAVVAVLCVERGRATHDVDEPPFRPAIGDHLELASNGAAVLRGRFLPD